MNVFVFFLHLFSQHCYQFDHLCTFPITNRAKAACSCTGAHLLSHFPGTSILFFGLRIKISITYDWGAQMSYSKIHGNRCQHDSRMEARILRTSLMRMNRRCLMRVWSTILLQCLPLCRGGQHSTGNKRKEKTFGTTQTGALSHLV